jgi:hypothetical protein
MFRYVLLLVLAAPLSYTAYDQAYALFEFDKRAARKAAAALDELQANVNDVRDSAERRGVPSENVQKAVLALGEDRPEVTRAGKEADATLVPPLQAHADNLKEIRQLFIAFGQIKKDRAARNNVKADYRGWLDEAAKVADLEAETKKLVQEHKGGESKKAILDNLDKLDKSPWHNPNFIQDTKAELARKDLPALDKLDKLDSRLETVLGGPPDRAPDRDAIAALAKDIDEVVRGLDDFAMKFAAIERHRNWAQQAAAKWRKCQELLRVVEKDGGVVATRDVAPHVEQYAKLIKGVGLPEGVRPLVRKSALRFCKSFLPKLDPDKDVWLDGEAVPRDAVVIVWLPAKAEALTVWQKKTGLTELDLAKAEYDSKVNYYEVRGGKQRQKPIDATPRTKAHRAYNKALATANEKGTTWPGALSGVLAECDSPLLREPRDRVKAVFDAMTARPELFGRD